MTSILSPDTETAERLIEGTVLENFVHVFGSSTNDDAGRRWMPNRGSLPSISGEATGEGLTGPFLLVDIGAFVNAIRGSAGSGDADLVGQAAEFAGDDEAESSGRGVLSKALLLGTVIGAAYAINRVRSADEPVDESENLARKAANTIQQRGEVAAERIEEGSQSLAERIEEGADTIDEAAGTAEDVKQDVSGSAENVKEDVSETAEDVKQDVSGTAEDVKEEAEDTAEDVKEEAEDTASDVREEAEETAGDVEDDVTTDSESGPKYET